MKEYFEIDQYSDTVESIAKKVESGLKFYDPNNQLPSGSYFHGYFHIDQIYPYREYDRSEIKKTEKGLAYWNKLKQDIKKNGITQCLWLSIYKNGDRPVLTEGNHRLAIAKEMGVKLLPIQFIIKSENYRIHKNPSKKRLTTKDKIDLIKNAKAYVYNTGGGYFFYTIEENQYVARISKTLFEELSYIQSMVSYPDDYDRFLSSKTRGNPFHHGANMKTDKQLLPIIKQFFSYLDPKAIIEIDDATDEDYPLVAIHFTTGDSYRIGYDNPRKEYFSVKLWVSRETRYEPEHSEWNDFSSYDYLYEACQHIGEQYVNDVMNRTAESLMEVVQDMSDELNKFDE